MRNSLRSLCPLWGTAAIFVALKFFVIFAPYHQEEFVLFDAALRTSQGEMPFRDYFYIYGPLPPYLYSLVFRLAAPTLIGLRLMTLLTSLVTLGFIWGLLAGQKTWARVAGTSIAMLPAAIYPAYAHNHVVSLMALTGILHFTWRYLSETRAVDYWLSVCLMVVLVLSRPMLAGLGAVVGWILVLGFGSAEPVSQRLKNIAVGLLVCAVALVCACLIFGQGYVWSLLPRSSASEVWTLSLEHVLYLFGWRESLSFSLSTLWRIFLPRVAYLCVILSPLAVLANWLKDRTQPMGRLAMVGFLLVMTGHFIDTFIMGPELVLLRGQYFLPPLMAIGWWFTTTPVEGRLAKGLRLGAGVSIGALGLLFASADGLATYRAATLPKYDHSPLRGTAIQPGHDGYFRALDFINEISIPNEPVLLAVYHPGTQAFLAGQNLLARDCCILPRNRDYVPRPHETPYSAEGKLSYFEIVEAEFRKHRPRIVLVSLAVHPSAWLYAVYCDSTYPHRKDFPYEFGTLRVCWK